MPIHSNAARALYAIVITLVFVLTINGHCHGQSLNYVRYDEKDGLPSSVVYSITEDRDGFLWFGTENGLCRFDGTTFKTYTTKDGLPDNSILKVHADNTGRILFNAFTHPPMYLKDGKLFRLKFNPENRFVLGVIVDLVENTNRTIVSGVEHGPFILYNDSDTLIPFRDVYPNIPYRNDEYGLVQYSDTSLTLIDIHNDAIQKVVTFISVKNGIYRLDTINVTPYTSGLLFHADNKKRVDLRKYISGPATMFSFLNNGWIAFYNKDLYYFLDLDTEQIIFTLPVNKPSCALIDSENNLWICTRGEGIYRYPSLSMRSLHFPASPEIHSFNILKGTVLAGSEFSLIHKIATDSIRKAGTIDLSGFTSQTSNVTTLSGKTNRTLRILLSGDTIYFATDAFLLKQLPSGKKIFRNIYPVKDIDTLGGQLLVCTGKSVLLTNRNDLSVTDTLLAARTTCGTFYQGNCYIGTMGGLIRINPRDKIIKAVDHPSLQNRITSIRRGNDDDLWITTSGSGLVHYKNGAVKNVFNTERGLGSDICTSVFIDGNTIWVGTTKGVNKLTIQGNETKVDVFTRSVGLSEDFVNTVFVHDSMVYTGSNTGITYFPKSASTTNSICKLRILQVSQGNKVLPADSVFTFSHDALNIRIDFTAISFKSQGDNRYLYKLEGLDTGWNETRNTFINYATLPASNYRLMIKAVNKFGVESEVRAISIIIIPPWWQSGWFITLAGLAFAALVFFIYRRNISIIKKREQVKRYNETKFAALEQQALQAQMNPHFIFNCLNSIQSFILDFDAEGANQYLTAFASMIRQTLDISSHPLITVAEEVRYLETYLQLEKLRFKEKFNYRIDVAEEIDTFGTWIPGMFLQPYVENSLRHGIQHRLDNNGLITLSIRAGTDNGVICSIRDNGIGRKKAAEMKSTRHIEYQSKGTFINSKRVKAINNQFNTNIQVDIEDITGDNGEVTGTEVTIDIPQLRKP